MKYIILIYCLLFFWGCKKSSQENSKEDDTIVLNSEINKNDNEVENDSLELLISYFETPNTKIPSKFFIDFIKVPYFTKAYNSGYSKELKYIDNNILVLIVTLECNAGGICEIERLFTIKNGEVTDAINIGEEQEDESFKMTVDYTFIKDTIIEKHERKIEYKFENTVDEEREVESEFSDYDYILISPEGKLNKIHNEETLERRFPQTSYRVFTNEELSEYSRDELDIMRNEIFATHGYAFKTKKWDSYFKEKEWYEPKFENVNDKLNVVEKINIERILKLN